MLKNIPEIITPDFLYALSAMGHGDSVVLADANFPAYRIAKSATLVHLPKIPVTEVLSAVLSLFPLDGAHPYPGYVMAVSEADAKRGIQTPIWDEFRSILKDATGRSEGLGTLERFDFYEASEKADLIVLTGERALYANILLYKGCL